MIDPSLEKLMKMTDSKYTLVVQAAKRARQICDDAQIFTNFDSDKPITLAIHEICENRITFKRIKEGIK